MTFSVIDNQTGKVPTHSDLKRIALEEEWAKHLIYCDISGWMVDEEGNLFLADDCDNLACPPEGRFTVAWEEKC